MSLTNSTYYTHRDHLELGTDLAIDQEQYRHADMLDHIDASHKKVTHLAKELLEVRRRARTHPGWKRSIRHYYLDYCRRNQVRRDLKAKGFEMMPAPYKQQLRPIDPTPQQVIDRASVKGAIDGALGTLGCLIWGGFFWGLLLIAG